jgi:hypothetical protein
LQRYAADETACYLQARITASGGNPDQIFTPRAMQAIHRATTGVPRLVNQLCEHAMILAAVGGHEQLDGPDIEEAWADLQQLPVPIPHNDVRDRAAPEKAIIEFGPLQQDDGPTPETSDFSETANLDPETRLDDIQRGIAAASQDAPFDSMDGSQCAEPELRDAQNPFSPPPGDARDDDGDIPGVPGASNPFDEEFEGEEVVLDRYASPDALARRSEHQVGCGVSAVLAERLTIAHPGLRLAQAPADEPSPDMPPTHAKGSRVSEVIVQFSGLMDPAADPVLPELFDEMMLPNGSGAPRSQPDVRAATATDGSDAAQYDPSGSDRKTTVGELEYQELATSVGSEPASTHRTFGKLFTRMRQR